MSEWSTAEKLLVRRASDVASGTEPLEDAGLPRALLGLCRAVFLRAHRSHTLRKSSELTPALRLFDKERLFPGGELLDARLALLFEVFGESEQRPVLEVAALQLLELQENHRWAEDPELHAEMLRLIGRKGTLVMPAIALESELLGTSTGRDRLADLPFNDRRLRLGELVAVLAQADEPATMKALVTHTFESTFQDCSMDERRLLMERLWQELDRHGRMEEHYEGWRLLFEPLMLQNRQAPSVQLSLLRRLDGLSGERLTPYLRFYLQTVPKEGLDLGVVERCAVGGVQLVPLLGPLTQERGWLGPTRLAATAQRALDAIVAREGLDGLAGGVTLVEDDNAGALSLANAREGGLSVAPERAVVRHEARVSPVQVAFVSLGFAGVLLLAWLLLS